VGKKKAATKTYKLCKRCIPSCEGFTPLKLSTKSKEKRLKSQHNQKESKIKNKTSQRAKAEELGRENPEKKKKKKKKKKLQQRIQLNNQ